MRDYYEILELKRNCTQEDIANSFRRLSIKNFPLQKAVPSTDKRYPKIAQEDDVNDPNYAINSYNFKEICEAYEVLSDPSNKGIYDIYGESGLKKGIVDKNGIMRGGYRFAGNTKEIFQKFMGTLHPFGLFKDFERLDDTYNTMFSSAFGGLYEKERGKLVDIEVEFDVTLEELYNGCVKKLTYKRVITNPDGRTTSVIQESKNIEIFKGFGNHTKLKFPGFGHEAPSLPNSDLIVKIKEIPHHLFIRKNNDLIYSKKIKLSDALNAESLKLVTLDGRNLSVSIDEIITPQTMKQVKSEGMPIYNESDPIQNLLYSPKKGDLYIKFIISFPNFIDPQKKDRLVHLLQDQS